MADMILNAWSREDLLKALMDAYGQNKQDGTVKKILRELKRREDKKEDPKQKSIAHMLGVSPHHLH